MRMTRYFICLAGLILGFSGILTVAAQESTEAPDTPLMVPSDFIMVPVPAGTFRMGNANTGDQNERPVHQVKLGAFMVSRTEITRGQYRALGLVPPGKSDQDDEPVSNVTWLDTVRFCNALSQKENLELVYTFNGKVVSADFQKNGYRLLTEAEWEYAARAAGTENFNYSGSDIANEVSWYDDNSSRKIQTVAQKKPNGLGIYDMSGNDWEWCWDLIAAYSSKTQSDPTGPAPSKKTIFRVIRGGAYSFNDSSSRCGFRRAFNPDSQAADIGFRVARTLFQG